MEVETIRALGLLAGAAVIGLFAVGVLIPRPRQLERINGKTYAVHRSRGESAGPTPEYDKHHTHVVPVIPGLVYMAFGNDTEARLNAKP